MSSPSAAPLTTASEWEERWRSVVPEDICTFIYTSGTTGPPKGCVISHGNYRAMLNMSLEQSVLESGRITYLYLPLAHSFALLIQLLSFDVGGVLAYWERDPLKILPNLAEVKPHYFPSVPRIFEKIYTAATSKAESAGGVQKAIFNWAVGVGRRVRELERQGKSPWPPLRIQYEIADRLVLSNIRNLFGGRIIEAVSGAAPINPEILRFFDAAGVLVLEGWGMTETSTAATISRPDEFKFGTIGKPFPGCEVKIADDGEILVRGPNVFQGYYKNPEATRETLVDGWLHTGDIGQIDADGYVKITGRKKDIIITAGGKNITPANIEAEVKQHPLVSQCVVIGDRRPYLVALVTLDPEEAATFATQHGLPPDPEAVASNPQVREAIEEHIEKVNQKFARVEQVKRFEILPRDLSQQGGELTPTLKVKRNVVADKYAGRDRVALLELSRSGRSGRARPSRRLATPTPASAASELRLRGLGARLLPEQHRRRLLQHAPPGRLLLVLALDLVEHMANPASRDLDAVALGDRLIALVVAGEPHGHGLEAVLGDLEAGAVVEDRGAEHELVVELGLDQDDVHAGIALLPLLDRHVQALVGQQPKGLVADRREPHVRDAAGPGAGDGWDPLAEVVRVGHQRVDDDDELRTVLDRDIDVRGRPDATVDELAAVDLDRRVDHR